MAAWVVYEREKRGRTHVLHTKKNIYITGRKLIMGIMSSLPNLCHCIPLRFHTLFGVGFFVSSILSIYNLARMWIELQTAPQQSKNNWVHEKINTS